MKKFLTLLLVLVLAFGLTMPAMAFTSDDQDDDDSIPYDLSIYLVEYDDNDLFGLIALPESDRGYAKNEIVAAVIELNIPEDEDILDDGYTALEITGDNVTYDVSDDPILNDDAEDDGLVLYSDGEDGWHLNFLDADDNGTFGDAVTFHDDTTYKWLVFAKVTDDEASMTAKLIDITGTVGFEDVMDEGVLDYEELVVTLSGTVYFVTLDQIGDDYEYEILWADDGVDYGILISTDEDYKSTGMYIGIDDNDEYDGTYFPLGVNTDGELGLVKGAIIDTSGDDYDDIMDVYEDVVVDVFGMDYFNIGHYVRKSFFEDLVSPDTLVATVDIEPWTAYVTVPDNIVVDPPKTGDAASIMGFVMVALSGAGAVALKKRS